MGYAKHILIQVDGEDFVNTTIFDDDLKEGEFNKVEDYIDGLGVLLDNHLASKNVKNLDRPVYTEIDKNVLNQFVPLLETIKGETEPFNGHTDPCAIEDCWKSVLEIAPLLIEALEHIFKPTEASV